MTIKIIEAFECTCDKCNYTWSSIKLPSTCANKTCRSPRWNKPPIGSLAAPQEDLVVEKKSAEASPDKKETIGGLQELINSIHAKTDKKFGVNTQPSKPPEDQPSYDELNIVSYGDN